MGEQQNAANDAVLKEHSVTMKTPISELFEKLLLPSRPLVQSREIPFAEEYRRTF